VLAPGVFVGRGEAALADLRAFGRRDPMARPSWQFESSDVYYLNAYRKPALVYKTLEAFVGDETMTRILRTWARRYRFQHPTTEDFIATVNEVSGQDWRWFFDETFFSSGLCDYSISVKDEPRRQLTGFADGLAFEHPPVSAPHVPKNEPRDGGVDSVVTVRRLGEVRMPVEIVVEFVDGRIVRESWDGRERWKRFTYGGAPKISRAAVDPDHKLAIDVDPSNNAWRTEAGLARQAAFKWSARFLFWLQNLLELHTVLG